MYVFNTNTPPLLEHIPDVISVPEELLRQELGRSQWNEASEKRTSSIVISWHINDITYDIIRVRRWVRTEMPVHYAHDVKATIKTTRGYKKTERETAEQALGLSVSAVIPFANLKASAKLDLKIKEESLKEWSEEVIEERIIEYKKDHTYVGWYLYDTLFIKRKIYRATLFSKHRTLTSESRSEDVNEFNVALKYYQDRFPKD